VPYGSQYKEGLNRALVAVLHNNGNFLRCVCAVRYSSSDIYRIVFYLSIKMVVLVQMFDNIGVCVRRRGWGGGGRQRGTPGPGRLSALSEGKGVAAVGRNWLAMLGGVPCSIFLPFLGIARLEDARPTIKRRPRCNCTLHTSEPN